MRQLDLSQFSPHFIVFFFRCCSDTLFSYLFFFTTFTPQSLFRYLVSLNSVYLNSQPVICCFERKKQYSFSICHSYIFYTKLFSNKHLNHINHFGKLEVYEKFNAIFALRKCSNIIPLGAYAVTAIEFYFLCHCPASIHRPAKTKLVSRYIWLFSRSSPNTCQFCIQQIQ